MRSSEITTGRTWLLVIEHGEEFFGTLAKFCAEKEIRAGYIPGFVGGFRSARLVGTCRPLQDPEAPLWDEITVESLEVLGGGTLAWDPEQDRVAPHIHVTAGLKANAAEGRTSHLLAAEAQFIVEVPIVEITAPAVTRRREPELYGVPLLHFGAPS